jgi:hypothetical protein
LPEHDVIEQMIESVGSHQRKVSEAAVQKIRTAAPLQWFAFSKLRPEELAVSPWYNPVSQ